MQSPVLNGFTLGKFEILPRDHLVIHDGETQRVEPKSMAVLLELATHGVDTVSRGELFEAVWPRGYVGEDVLNRCISQLRSVLGDDARAPRFIATVPRIGYRLLQAPETPARKGTDGVLVLPFQNLAAHGADEYLADGLTELLIARLAVVLDQRVFSRTTAMTYKGQRPEIGAIRERLGPKWIIEGSLLQLGAQLQIIVQLIDAETDSHAWAETWTRPAEDIMSVLNEVTRQVSTHINAHLSESAGTIVPSATLPDGLMRRYLQGMHHVSRRAAPSLRQALVCFDDVLEAHPDHAPALSGKAMCHMLLVHYGAEPAAVGIPLVKALSARALEIDPRNSEAMGHLGAASFFYEWDFDNAERLAVAALKLRPNFEMAMLLLANVNLVRGCYEQSQALVDRALSIDPLNIGVLMNAGDLLILQRRYGEAIRSLSQALELEPRFRPACLRLALAWALRGRPSEAERALQRALQLGEEDALHFEYRALISGQANEMAAAGAAVEALEKRADRGETVLPWSLARACAAAQQTDRAIAWLEKAFESRSSSMPFLGQTPVFDALRQRQEVQLLMQRLGLPV